MVQTRVKTEQAISEISLQDSIHYQGRKAARAKSEHRRRIILEAALRIVAKEGVRGVKHRAVAKEAQVPLASTTYYFKDIEELITDAFMLFAEKSQQVLELFYGELNKLVVKYDADMIRSDELTRLRFTEELVEMGVRYIKAQVQFRRDDVLAEMAFLMEALRDKQLQPLAKEYRMAWFTRLVSFLMQTKSSTPAEDAMCIISGVQALLYESVLNDGAVNEHLARSSIRRLMSLLLKG